MSSEQRNLLFAACAAFGAAVLWHGWISEDAFITLRVVDNFLGGHGLRWNVDERVQVYTHPLWMLLLIPSYALFREPLYATLLPGVACAIGGFYAWGRRLESSPLVLLTLWALPLLLSRALLEYSVAGLENPLAMLLVAGFFARLHAVADGDAKAVPWSALSLLTALLLLTRLDLALTVAPAWTWLLWRHRARLDPRAMIAGSTPLVGWLAFSFLYYGFLFPNTKYAKLGAGIPLADRLGQSTYYFADLAQNHLVTAVAITVGLCITAAVAATRVGGARDDRAAFAVLPGAGALIYLAYLASIAGDHYSGRYFTVPLVLLAITASSAALRAPATTGTWLPRAAMFLPMVALIGEQVRSAQNVGPGRIEDARRLSAAQLSLESYHPEDHPWIKEGRSHKQAAEGQPEGSHYAFVGSAAGMMMFTAGPGAVMVDYLGITDPLLARLPLARKDKWHASHYWRSVPSGYAKARRNGDLGQMDPDLAEYYAPLREIVGGPLLSPHRLWTTVKFNLGLYDGSRDAWVARMGLPADPDAVETDPEDGDADPGRHFICEPDRFPTPRPVAEGWKAPLARPKPPVRLLEHVPEVSGDARDASGPLQRWSGAEVAKFEATRWRDQQMLAGPDVDASARGARWATVRFRGDGVHALGVVPIAMAGPGADWDRGHRWIALPIGASDRVDGIVTVQVDLRQALGENWDDATNGDRALLRRLELGLGDVRPDDVELIEVRLDGEERGFDGAVGVADVDRGGVIHPAWYVWDGASATVEVQVPTGDPELLLHTAGLSGAGEVVIELDAGGAAPERIARPAGRGWALQKLSMKRWAGRKVAIRLSSAGAGVGFFGYPVIHDDSAKRVAPDVIVYLVDTLHASQIGAWGNPRRGISQTIDRMVREGVTFGRAMSTSPWTKPAIPTLMTGLNPTTHQVGAHTYTEKLPPTVPTLQKRFGAAGWRTGSFSASPLGSTLSGLEHGFGTAVAPSRWDGNIGAMGHPSALQVQQSFLAWVDEAPERPFMAYLHTLDVHEYGRPMYRTGYGDDWRPYERAIRQQDVALARLLAELEKRGRDVIVVLVSDHGESFGEFGRNGHGTSLYQSQLHVPLVFWGPNHLPHGTIDDVVSLQDVAPTLAEMFGLEPFPLADGVSLLPYFQGDPAPLHPFVPSSRLWYVWTPNDPRLFAAQTSEGRKVIHVEGGARMAFAMAQDPCELRVDLAGSGQLHTQLDAWLTGQQERADAFATQYGRATTGAIDASDVERLRALGYVQ